MKKERTGYTQKTAAPLASSADPRLRTWWQADWLFILFLLFATILAYQPIWHAGFLTDDGALLLKNGLVQEHDGWWRVWCSRVVDYVPATSTTFWLEWRLWAANPLGYHLDNVLLHSVSAILVWQILNRLKIPAARLAAAIFALHPVSVASVAWIAERKNTLAMVFYAAALLSYLVFEDTGKRRWYWIAVGAFILGIFSKTAIAPLPLVLLGMAWWRRGGISSKDAGRICLFFVLAAAGGALGIWIQHAVDNSFVVRSESIPARLAGAGWAVWFYLGKCLWPQHLSFLYPKWHINPKDPLAYLPAMLVLAVLGAGWFYRRGWGKALLFGFGYYIVMLLPVLGLVDISLMGATLVADHWQYFAIIGPITLVVAGLAVLFTKCNGFLRFALVLSLLTGLGILTWEQSRIYVNPYAFWQATIDRNPESFLAHSGFGNALFQKGKVQGAIAHYQRALELAPGFCDAHYDLGNIFLQEGQPAEAIFQFKKALEIQPGRVLTLNNLAWVLATCPDGSVRNGSQAIELATRANELSAGKEPSIIGTLAAAYAEAGQFSAAITVAQQALQLAGTRNDTSLIKDLQPQLDSYRKGLPFRDLSQIVASPGPRH